jgi:hypothetical protein
MTIPVQFVCEDRSIVDIELIKRNALTQGIVLQEIAILYIALTDEEKNCLRELNLLKYDVGNTAIANLHDSGEALFPEKIKGVEFLGAD